MFFGIQLDRKSPIFHVESSSKKVLAAFVTRAKHGEHFFCVAFHMKRGPFSIEFNAIDNIKTVFAFIIRKKVISTYYSPLLVLQLLVDENCTPLVLSTQHAPQVK